MKLWMCDIYMYTVKHHYSTIDGIHVDWNHAIAVQHLSLWIHASVYFASVQFNSYYMCTQAYVILTVDHESAMKQGIVGYTV